MDERFPDEFVTWRHSTPIGVKVDEVFGMDCKNGKTWIELAKQIYAEQGEIYYRIIEHFPDGAPYLEGYPGRISVTHTTHFLAVGSLPKTPEVNLQNFNPRSAMGIDAEYLSREQVIKIRKKFLSESELELIPENDLEKNIIAWTVKEAVYKLALTPGLDFKDCIEIKVLPVLDLHPENSKVKDFGKAVLTFPEDTDLGSHEILLYSYVSYGCCVTIATSTKSAKFGKH